MSKFSTALILAAGLSLSAAALSYADDLPAKSAKMLGRLNIVHHQKTCVYKCSAGKLLCPGDYDPNTGCYFYTCITTRGVVGSDPCP